MKENCYWYESECDMGARISYCKPKGHILEPDDCTYCNEYHNKNKRTRGDNIRSMTDSELTELFMSIKASPCIEECRTNWLAWLKEEYKKGEENNG